MTKAATLSSKTANLAIATDIDKKDRNKLQNLLNGTELPRWLVSRCWTGSLIGAAILGQRLLSPEEEAAVLQREANEVLPAAAVELTGQG